MHQTLRLIIIIIIIFFFVAIWYYGVMKIPFFALWHHSDLCAPTKLNAKGLRNHQKRAQKMYYTCKGDVLGK